MWDLRKIRWIEEEEKLAGEKDMEKRREKEWIEWEGSGREDERKERGMKE